MKYSTIRISIIWVLLLTIQCTNHKGDLKERNRKKRAVSEKNQTVYKKIINNDTLYVCNYSNVSNEVSDVLLSSFIDTCIIVSLETSQDAYVNVASTIVTDKFIGIRNYGGMPFKLFDHSGKYITNIGETGRKPNEYNSIYSEAIDEKNNTVYLLPWRRDEILRYNLSGNPLSPVKLKYGITKANMFVSSDTITILNLPFSAEDKIAYVQTTSGQVINEVTADSYALSPNFSDEIISSHNSNSYDLQVSRFSDVTNDTLYHFKKNHLQPVFTVNFNNEEDIPVHNYFELPGYFICQTYKAVQGPRRTATARSDEIILINKETLEAKKIRLVNDYLGNIEMEFNFRDGKFINTIYAIDLMRRISAVLNSGEDLPTKTVKKITDFIKSLSDEDNYIVFFGNIK